MKLKRSTKAAKKFAEEERRTQSMFRKLLLGSVCGLFAMVVAAQVSAQADVIEKRQKAMKGISAASKEIKAAVGDKNYSTVEAKAKDIMGTAEKIPSLFPKGSTAGKTKATPAIWDKSDDFAKAAQKLAKAAGEVASAAKAGDDADVAVKVKEMGATCGACHKPFRAEKYAE
jgi:cytochrome c556